MQVRCRYSSVPGRACGTPGKAASVAWSHQERFARAFWQPSIVHHSAAMQPGEFMTIAGRLAVMNLGAAGARTAVSRAYYGAFHLAMNVLEQFASAPPRNGNGHVLAPAFLESANHADAIVAASLLQDLHTARIKADYQIGDLRIETPEFATSEIEVATEIQRRLASFSNACRLDPAVVTALREGIAQTRAIRGL